jgi:hypothetical protein
MPENTPDYSADATGSTSAIASSESDASAGSDSRVSREPVRVQGQPRWIAPAALLVAVVATALAVWALVGKSPDAPAATAGTGETDSKAGVCTTFATVTNAVSLQTHNNLGAEPVAEAAVAGNARLALFGGGQYLLNSIQPDTPKELAESVRAFASKLQAVGMNALAGLGNADAKQAPLLADAEQDRKKIADLCK